MHTNNGRSRIDEAKWTLKLDLRRSFCFWLFNLSLIRLRKICTEVNVTCRDVNWAKTYFFNRHKFYCHTGQNSLSSSFLLITIVLKLPIMLSAFRCGWFIGRRPYVHQKWSEILLRLASLFQAFPDVTSLLVVLLDAIIHRLMHCNTERRLTISCC